MSSSNMTTSTIGFPRIGPNREMKKALERCAPLDVPILPSVRRFFSIVAADVLRADNFVAYSYWKKQLSLEDLLKVNDQTEMDAWQLQAKAGKAPGCIATFI